MAFDNVQIVSTRTGAASITGWRQDLVIGDVMAMQLTDTTGVSSYRWELVGRPEGSIAGGPGPEPILLSTGATAGFTVDSDVGMIRDGTYIVHCTLNGGTPTETVISVGLARLAPGLSFNGLPLRKLGGFETLEDTADPPTQQGWCKMLDRWLGFIQVGGGGPPPGATTLAIAYNAGLVIADQTLALLDAKGGGLVIDGTSVLFTGAHALSVKGVQYISESLGVGVTTPSASIHVAAGTATAGTAPLKIPSGVVLTIPEAGAVEANNDHIYWTNSTGTRLQLDNSAGATITLAAAYANGISAADQTLTIANAKGGGVLVDASTAAVTSGLYSLEIRQSASQSTPTALTRRGNDSTGPILEFNKARGAYPPGALADVQANDSLGTVNIFGRLGGLPVLANSINALCTSVSGGLWSALDFYAISHGTLVASWRMTSNAPNGQLIGLSVDPQIYPTTTQTGSLGLSTNVWLSAYLGNAFVSNKVAVGLAAATALVHIHAGTATAATAPIKINPGVVMTIPESGAIESTTTHIYWTNAAGTRLQLDNASSGAETLAATYALGANANDQTMIVTTAKGGAVVADASTVAVTGDGYVLETRQSASHITNTAISRRGNDAVGPRLEFNKARGTYAIPADVHAGDEIGAIDFNCQLAILTNPAARINTVVTSLGEGGPFVGLDFYTAVESGPTTLVHNWRMMSTDPTTSLLIGYGTYPIVQPVTTLTGGLGDNLHIWDSAWIKTAWVTLNEVIDSTSSGGALYSLEIRQSTGFETPTQINRAGNDALPPVLQLYKTRGTNAAPLNIQTFDELGTINFYGRNSGTPTVGARVTSVCQDTGAYFCTSLEFYVVPIGGTSTRAWSMDLLGNGNTAELIGYGTAPKIYPRTDQTGSLGIVSQRWATLYVDTADVYANVCVGGGAVGGGANFTVLLTNAAFMPAPQANQVYLGAADMTEAPFAGAGAAWALSQEALVIPTGGSTPDSLIAITVNGEQYGLFALSLTPKGG